jgi:hypothetical protein
VVALATGVLVVELARLPPLRDPNGGWPAARAAAERIVQTAGDRTLLVAGLPAFKPADGLVFPLLRAGAQPAGDAASAGALVVVCDRLFEVTMGAACGGQAEQAVERQRPAFSRLVDRFDLSGRTLVSVYLRAE